MHGKNRFWILLLVIGLLAVTGCTENDLDESEADVWLAITGFTAPPVVAGEPEGTCQADPGVECNQDSDCEFGICDLVVGSGCDIQNWTITFKVEPLNEGALLSNLNSVIVDRIDVTFPGGGPTGYVLTPGTVIDVAGGGTVNFPPILIQDLVTDSTAFPVEFAYTAHTANGNSVEVVGGTGNVLVIEDCL